MRVVLLTVLALIFGTVASAQTPQQIEHEILGHLQTILKTGTYSGTYDEDKLYGANRALRAQLLKLGNKAAVLKYAFPKLKNEMFVATSKDGRLRIYSWDMQTGGTMHDYASVLQYRGKSGRVYTVGDGDDEDSGGAFYTDIFQVSSATGPIYLAASTFIASSSLNGQSIDAMRVDGEKLERNAKVIRTRSGLQSTVDFAYDFFSVVDRKERPVKLFSFNEAKKEFRFPVVIEDKRTPQGRVTNRFITYRFDGKYFVRVN